MAKTKTVRVTLEVPAGKSCGVSWAKMCRFLLLTEHGSGFRRKRIHCVLHDQDIELKGRYYMKCQACINSEEAKG